MKKLKAGRRRQPALRKGRKKNPPPLRRQIEETPPLGAVPAPDSDILNEAALALQADRPSAALAHCQAALATDPGNAEALNLAGIALFQLGEAKQALSMLETAVAYHPDHIDALNNLGNVRKTLGWLTEAEAAYRRALRRWLRVREHRRRRALHMGQRHYGGVWVAVVFLHRHGLVRFLSFQSGPTESDHSK